jgi:hypothetical protein
LASQTHLHEGDRLSFHRNDGTIVPIAIENHKYEATIHLDEFREKGLAAAVGIAEHLRTEMAQDITHKMITEVSDACEQIGNTVGGPDKPLSAEVILEGLEKMAFDFDENGEWIRPTFVIHPSTADAFKAQITRLDTNPELRDRMAYLLNQKRITWRDREARRKLAD